MGGRTLPLAVGALLACVVGVTLLVQVAHLRSAHVSADAARRGRVHARLPDESSHRAAANGVEATGMRSSMHADDGNGGRSQLLSRLERLDRSGATAEEQSAGGGRAKLDAGGDEAGRADSAAAAAEEKAKRLESELDVAHTEVERLRSQLVNSRAHGASEASQAGSDSSATAINSAGQAAPGLATGAVAAHAATTFAPEVEGQETAFDPEAVVVTYETCMASLEGKPRAKRWREAHGASPLYWLHIPKCGTSFGAAIHGFTCTADSPAGNTTQGGGAEGGGDGASAVAGARRPCEWCGPDAGKWRGYDHTLVTSIPFADRPFCDPEVPFEGAFKNHIVLPASVDFTRMGDPQAVALFRDPRRRLVSGWNDNKHSYAMGSWWDPRGPEEEVRAMRESTRTVEEYAAWPGIAGCQVKMLVGEDCGVPLKITRAVYEEAERRLHNMAFVGLTDAFNASVCLFHHMYGGMPAPYMFTTHSRSGAKLLKGKRTLQCGVGEKLPREAWRNLSLSLDPFDARLYETAKAVFAARLQKHRLWKPNMARLKHICRDTKRLKERGCRFRLH